MTCDRCTADDRHTVIILGEPPARHVCSFHFAEFLRDRYPEVETSDLSAFVRQVAIMEIEPGIHGNTWWDCPDCDTAYRDVDLDDDDDDETDDWP